MEEQISVVFSGGPCGGQMDTIALTGQPKYVDTRDGGWALYALTPDTEGGRRVLRYQHGSEEAVPAQSR